MSDKTFAPFAAAGLLVAILGCSTQPVATSAARSVDAQKWGANKEGYGTLIVKRDKGTMGAACKAGVYIDGDHVGSLGTSDKVTLYLPPGEHIVGARNGGLCGGAVSETSLALTSGMQKTYRISIGDMGAITIQPTAF